jgi:catechol 2,3-dioxygenase-like lactoylglutathione lyase family enzyme
MRTRSTALFLSLAVWAFSANAQTSLQRPPITGISHVSVYATDPAKTGEFFVTIIGLSKAADPENPAGQRYYVNPTQFVEVLPLPSGKSPASLDHIAYITGNARRMRAYLAAHGVAAPAKLQRDRDGVLRFRVDDPEGNVVEFVQNPARLPARPGAHPIGDHMIHAGFLVQSRANEDSFYRDVLGFRPYWYGGPREDVVAWVSQQVPNGRDWLEYMLTTNGHPPTTASALGVLNHFSLGVKDMAATTAALRSAGHLDASHGGPKIGADGKWQLNLYDPDGTRVELMEFNNVKPPCCSPFTAPNPTPQ